VHNNKQGSVIGRFVRWLFGAPFQELPTEFGDLVPAELRVFEAQVEEAQHQAIGSVVSPSADYHLQIKAVRQGES
jgi:hypothetical protein